MIPESPRWLVTQGRFEEAKKIVQYMAEVNGNTMPEKYTFTQVTDFWPCLHQYIIL